MKVVDDILKHCSLPETSEKNIQLPFFDGKYMQLSIQQQNYYAVQ